MHEYEDIENALKSWMKNAVFYRPKKIYPSGPWRNSVGPGGP